ncbi:MAG: type II toxin-antitoxin system RelE/ParE family toxin [Chlamydiales bacterium]|nr:type II toxin-antitoxin system RelE/ParE family toxin [Chlamydiales bacterium]
MNGSSANRQLIYLGSSKKDAEKLPQEVKDLFSAALKMALIGATHEDAKPYRHHGSGVFEVIGDYRNSTFREVYTVRYKEVVFVIHIFQKKSKKGSEVPKEDKELIEQRMKWAEQIYKELYGKKKKS